MEEKISPEEKAFEALVAALVEGGWEVTTQLPLPASDLYEAKITHQSLPSELLPILFKASTGPSIRFDDASFDNSTSSSVANVLGLTVNIEGMDSETIKRGDLNWSLFHHDDLAGGPITFKTPVAKLADYIPYVLETFDKWAEEETQETIEKKLREEVAKKEKPETKIGVKELKGVSGKSKRPGSQPDAPPLPFEFVPGADPGEADIIILPVSVDGLLSDDTRSTLKWIGFEGPWPVDVDLSQGYGLVEGTTKDELVLFVVTRQPNRRVAHLLDANLPKALAHLSQEVNLADRIVHVPLMQSETGAKGLQAGLDVILRSFSSALTNSSNQPARIIIAPPDGVSKKMLARLRSRLPKASRVKSNLVGSPVDAAGHTGLSDAVPDEPKLGFPDIARSFVQFIDEMVAEKSASNREGALITIGLFGRWGTGKSTMIEALRKAFGKRYVQIMVNAWKWDGKEDIHTFFKRAFLDELKTQRAGIYKRYERKQKLFKSLRWLISPASLVIFLLIYYLAYLGAERAGLFELIQTQFSGLLADLGVKTFGFLAMGIPAYKYLYQPNQPKLADWLEAKLESPEFRDLGREGLNRTYREIATLGALGSDGRSSTPFIFYIDDLDRCLPDRVATFVQSIHSLTAAGCVTFVACDEAYVSSALQSHFEAVAKYHPEKDDFGRNFLDKIIQVPFRVPALDHEGLADLGLTRKRVTEFTEPDEDVPTDAGSGGNKATPPTAKVKDAAGGAKVKIEPDGKDEEQKIPLPSLPDHYRDGIQARSEKFCRELRVTSEEERDTVYAFCFADRYLPAWLDKFQKSQMDPMPDNTFGSPDSQAEEEIDFALATGPEIVGQLLEHRLVRISEVMDVVLKPLVGPLKLALRDVKNLTNQLSIYLRIDPFENFDEAKIAAAYLLADRLDPIWLDKHMGLTILKDANKEGRINRADPDVQTTLREMINKKKVDDLKLRRWRASA